MHFAFCWLKISKCFSSCAVLEMNASMDVQNKIVYGLWEKRLLRENALLLTDIFYFCLLGIWLCSKYITNYIFFYYEDK